MTQDADSSELDRPNLVERLKAQVAGLTCPSESDYPFEVQEFSNLLPERNAQPFLKSHLQQTGYPPNTPIEEVDLDSFFAPLLQRSAQDESQKQVESEEQAEAELSGATPAMPLELPPKSPPAPYQNLKHWLETNLTDIKVYRLGVVEIDVYIVGKTPSNEWIGLSTKLVET